MTATQPYAVIDGITAYPIRNAIFLHDWLSKSISAIEYAEVKDMSIEVLRQLYPDVWVGGQHLPEFKRHLPQLNLLVEASRADESHLFIRELYTLGREIDTVMSIVQKWDISENDEWAEISYGYNQLFDNRDSAFSGFWPNTHPGDIAERAFNWELDPRAFAEHLDEFLFVYLQQSNLETHHATEEFYHTLMGFFRRWQLVDNS